MERWVPHFSSTVFTLHGPSERSPKKILRLVFVCLSHFTFRSSLEIAQNMLTLLRCTSKVIRPQKRAALAVWAQQRSFHDADLCRAVLEEKTRIATVTFENDRSNFLSKDL